MANRLNQLGINHVVVLTLENRGFDHVMGWLYDNENPDDLPSNVLQVGGDNKPNFIGLSGGSKQETSALLKKLANKPKYGDQPIEPIKGASTPRTPSFNPGEHFTHIMAQMYGKPRSEVDWGDPTIRAQQISDIGSTPMNGYVLDYAESIEEDVGIRATDAMAKEILETYVPEQLPVLSGLARHYCISDYWFCSVPSQTNTNRAFATAGTSLGLVTNNFYDAHKNTKNPGLKGLKWLLKGSHADRLPEYPNNLFNLLNDNGVSWKVFWQSEWPPLDASLGFEHQYVRTMFRQLDDKKYNDNFVKFNPDDSDNKLFKAAREGRLPAVSWIEPKWGGGPSWDSTYKSKARVVGNDMHPVSDTLIAENFVQRLYDALSKREDGSENPFWKQTVFVITFDENGGTYDHVPPPKATPSARDKAPYPGEYPNMDKDTRTQFGFKFDRFGIRIPTIIASPYVKPKTVFRNLTKPFDHTSVIATILDWKNIDRKSWLLGERVANAPLFDSVLELDQARDKDTNIMASLGTPVNNGAVINYGDEVLLEFIGSKWGNGQYSKYLAKSSRTLKTFYPTLSSNKGNAAVFKLFADKSKDTGKPIKNMATIRIASTEQILGNKNVLSAFHDSHYLYYYTPDDNTTDYWHGERWQIVNFSSRDNQQTLRDGDELFLLSFLRPLQPGYSRITPDPFCRMTISPKNADYLTTLAGEWAIWKITKVNN
ncbi:alkaline phosphatase family protein [Paraferrimonas sp. SM1919]|uniref:alkaline phosphatase family protein n=1 Tax=Paraferrimonas sp. SM1919 TaxID=2662263 RepID=UPI0013D7D540|nr:alkaline phosphatase family protein [Paraferrimonas sp. SM1919]